MYLRIVNPGVCPVEGFTVLGVSTSRDDESAIGQFGSGNKHAINVCLRHGINPIIYCGTKRLEFFTQPTFMNEKQYNRVFIKVSNKKPRPLSIAMEYGELDWTKLDMALREFVSNALDVVGGDTTKITIDIVNTVTARPNKTVIAIPLTPEVQRFYQQLPCLFLQFQPQHVKGQVVLVKKEPGPAKIYRKNVFVREIQSDVPSLFDYNFGEELKINESRNLSDYACQRAAAIALTKSDQMVGVFQALATHRDFWEKHFSVWDLEFSFDLPDRELWKKFWKEAFGDQKLSSPAQLPLDNIAAKRGHHTAVINSSTWFEMLKKAGIPTVIDALTDFDKDGRQVVDVTPTAQHTLDEVWKWIDLLDLTNGKSKPEIRCFDEICKDDKHCFGYYQNGIVYINVENDNNHQTILEEVAHYITGATDLSRAIQEYGFKMAVKMAKQHYSQ